MPALSACMSLDDSLHGIVRRIDVRRTALDFMHTHTKVVDFELFARAKFKGPHSGPERSIHPSTTMND